MVRFVCLTFTLLLIDVASSRGAETVDVDFFEKKIRPVLVEKCYSCHSADAKKVRGGLLLDTRDATRKGGDNGPSVVPGDAKKSLLIKAMKGENTAQMPPKGKLPENVIRDFETWVNGGAIDPRDGKKTVTPTVIDFDKARQFWSFQPPKNYPAPIVKQKNWVRRSIDPFILEKLEKTGLSPAPFAERETFIRRVTFDLTGLPPTPDEVTIYLADTAPDADERLIDRLLASSNYGERWARVWLDVARYAEDQAHIVGNDQTLTYPNAYLYRDWVIQSLNADMSYDRFVSLQLAADQIEGDASPNLVALGYIGLGPKYYNRGNPAVNADEWEDRVDVIGRGLIGLTIACARCHDHKFDPIPTTDYYSLAGVFASTDMFNRPDPKAPKKEDGSKSPLGTMHIVKDGKVADINVLIRGNVENKGPITPRRFLRVLSDSEPTPFKQGSGRKELAATITDPKNPLLARVIVNRIWAQYFGRGIVATPSNFGKLGELPTHPELLDDLSKRFIDNGWSLKWLHREIVLSATYHQSSHVDAKSMTLDADNRLLGRMPRRRLPVESWRDALLATSGMIDTSRIGGPSIDPLDLKEHRRTVYTRISRLELNKLLAMFDFPDPNATADKRVETTTPLQKLFTLNSPFMTTQGDALASRLLGESQGDDRSRIHHAYQLLYARTPSEAELKVGLQFVQSGTDHAVKWRRYSHALLAANEMLFLD